MRLLEASRVGRKPEEVNAETFRAASNFQLYRQWRMVPMHLELTVRRLKLVQDWALHPHEHSQELAAVFGMLRLAGAVDPLLPDGRVAGRAHPWLKQMMEDLEILALLEDGRAIHDTLDGQPLLLFQDSDAHSAFTAMDIGQLRAWWLAQAQPASAIFFA